MNIAPLLYYEVDTNIAIYKGNVVKRSEFLERVELAKKQLLKPKYVINLCENRYHFLVVFAACVSLNKISLLPGSKAEKEIKRLTKTYPDNCLVNDNDIKDICEDNDLDNLKIYKPSQIDQEQIVAIVFTSGTTGDAKENLKTWGELTQSAKKVRDRFGLNTKKQHYIVATVPPQHMFGFETTIIYPLILGLTIFDGQPFYPLDIQQALNKITSPRILITTPLHLKACSGLKDNWTDIDFVISATSKLSKDIAIKSEQILDTKVFEIYGCSEAGAIATRQTTKDDKWQLLQDYKIIKQNNRIFLKAPSYSGIIAIPDTIKKHNDKYFYLLGRSSDLVKIGGKRESLTNLANKLKKINKVDDAVFFIPNKNADKRTRMAALVVAPNCSIKQLSKELLKFIDPVFMPRPLILVDKLPYNEFGKLPFVNLIKILNNHLKSFK